MTEELLKIGPGTTLRVLALEPERLELEATYEPGGAEPPAHLHPSQDERFELLAGTMRTRIDGREGEILAGEPLEIPAGTVHQMWNAGTERTVLQLDDDARRAHARLVPRGGCGARRRTDRRAGDDARALQRRLQARLSLTAARAGPAPARRGHDPEAP